MVSVVKQHFRTRKYMIFSNMLDGIFLSQIISFSGINPNGLYARLVGLYAPTRRVEMKSFLLIQYYYN